MKQVFNYITLVSAIIMIVMILLQTRGSSLGATFGGDGNVYRSKRGAEKLVYNLTIVSAVVFVLSVILSILSTN